MEIKNYLLECERCVDRCELEKVMQKRWGKKVKLTKLEGAAVSQIFEDARRHRRQVYEALSDWERDWQQLGQILGVKKK